MPNNSSKPCHNCRRRRLRCDRSWPSCHKCTTSGQECLGYGQLFVWTEGIDSAGNVKRNIPPPNRKSFVEQGAADAENLTVGPGHLVTPASNSNEHQSGIGLKSQHPQLQQPHQDSYGSRFLASAPSTRDTHAQSPQPPNSRPHSEMSASCPSPTVPLQPPSETYSLVTLTDPLFQDLDRNSRYYLSHFADRVCQDLVALDASGSNPFRQLIPLANKHPLLLEILVATSAMHWSNIFRPSTSIPADLTKGDGYLAQLRSKDLVSRGAFIDALAAKQRAMGHLREVLDTLDPAGSEVVLAAMHFFIKFDLIDMERTEGPTWRTHLEGAFSILSLLSPNAPSDHSQQMLRDCVIADCFIYHIFGSTLTASGGLAGRIARYGYELLPVMERVEMNGYLSCPPEILSIILSASRLSCEAPSTDESLTMAEEALALIDQALAFDLQAWSWKLESRGLGEVKSRVCVASAHRSATCLYIQQALPLVRAVRPVDSEFLVNDILTNLSMVKESDWFFKASSWPIFIAGAETRDAEKRTWCLHRLLAIWETCPWGYIFTAIEMLKATWEMQDAQSPAEAHDVNWLQVLKRLGYDYLIV